MKQLSSNQFESWLYNTATLCTDLIYKYYNTFVVVVFSPSTAMSEIKKEDIKYMSPLLFFLCNIAFASLFSNSDTTNILSLASQIINLPINPEKTNYNYITTFLSYLLGGFIFIVVFQSFFKRILKVDIGKSTLINAISYASAIFVPIWLIKRIILFVADIISLNLINNFSYHSFLEYADASFSQEVNLFLQTPYLILVILILNLITMSWWLYLVFKGISINNIFSKIELGKTLIYSIITFIFLSYLASMIPATDESVSQLKEKYIENLIISNLQENKPKYGKIAFLCELIGNDKNLSNYVRYRYTLMASVYIVGNLDSTQPLFKESEKALLEKRFDWIEQNFRQITTNTLKDDSKVATKIAKHDLIHILNLLDNANTLKQKKFLENDDFGKINNDKFTVLLKLFP